MLFQQLIVWNQHPSLAQWAALVQTQNTPQMIKARICHGTQPARGWAWMAELHLVSLSSNKTKLTGTIHYLRGPTARLSNTLSELIKCLFKAEVNVNTKVKVNWLTCSVLCLIISVRNELLALRPCAGGSISCSHQGCWANLPHVWFDFSSSVSFALDTENVFWLGRMFWI